MPVDSPAEERLHEMLEVEIVHARMIKKCKTQPCCISRKLYR